MISFRRKLLTTTVTTTAKLILLLFYGIIVAIYLHLKLFIAVLFNIGCSTILFIIKVCAKHARRQSMSGYCPLIQVFTKILASFSTNNMRPEKIEDRGRPC